MPLPPLPPRPSLSGQQQRSPGPRRLCPEITQPLPSQPTLAIHLLMLNLSIHIYTTLDIRASCIPIRTRPPPPKTRPCSERPSSPNHGVPRAPQSPRKSKRPPPSRRLEPDRARARSQLSIPQHTIRRGRRRAGGSTCAASAPPPLQHLRTRRPAPAAARPAVCGLLAPAPAAPCATWKAGADQRGVLGLITTF